MADTEDWQIIVSVLFGAPVVGGLVTLALELLKSKKNKVEVKSGEADIEIKRSQDNREWATTFVDRLKIIEARADCLQEQVLTTQRDKIIAETSLLKAQDSVQELTTDKLQLKEEYGKLKERVGELETLLKSKGDLG